MRTSQLSAAEAHETRFTRTEQSPTRSFTRQLQASSASRQAKIPHVKTVQCPKSILKRRPFSELPRA